MSIGTAIPREELRGLIQRLVGASTTWGHAPLGFHVGARVLLSVASYAELGWDDDQTAEYIPAVRAQRITSRGNRTLKVNVRVDSFDPAIFSLDVAENIRRRLNTAGAHDELHLSNLAYTGSESLVSVDWIVDGTSAASAIMLLTFNHRVVEVDVNNDGGIIETAPITGVATT